MISKSYEKFPNCVKSEEKIPSMKYIKENIKLSKIHEEYVLKEECVFFFSSRTMITHFVVMS